jgi:hypothetical protein
MLPLSPLCRSPALKARHCAMPVSASQINLTWTDNSSGELGFRIDTSTDGSNYRTAAIAGPNATSYSLTMYDEWEEYWTWYGNMMHPSDHEYRVRAVDNGAYSDWVYLSVDGAPSYDLPGRPTGLAASSVTSRWWSWRKPWMSPFLEPEQNRTVEGIR